jgi:hypothetical protein
MIPPKAVDKPLFWNAASPTEYRPADGNVCEIVGAGVSIVLLHVVVHPGVESLNCQLKSAVDGSDPVALKFIASPLPAEAVKVAVGNDVGGVYR